MVFLELRRSSRKPLRRPRPRELRAFFSCMTWRAIPGSLSRELRASALCPGLEAQFPARRREERGCRPLTGILFSLERGLGIALQVMQEKKALSSRGRGRLRASLAQRSPASSLLAREGAGCGSMRAAAAAKSLQSFLTLCDPIDSSPSGSAIPGILQARILEWVAISNFSIA